MDRDVKTSVLARDCHVITSREVHRPEECKLSVDIGDKQAYTQPDKRTPQLKPVIHTMCGEV